MENKFKLSSFNLKYSGVVALIYLIPFFFFSDKTAYQIGALAGKLLVLLFLPALFAWIVWRLAGKREKAASVTFNVVMSLMLFGQVFNLLQQPEAAMEGQEQEEVSRVMGEYGSNMQAIVEDWRAVASSLQSAGVLDYSLLTNDTEFDRQRRILRDYIEKTMTYVDSFTNTVPYIEAKLSVLGEGNLAAKEAVDGFRKGYLQQKPFFDPLMQAHIDYANNQVEILNLLQRNKNEWADENGQLVVYNDELLDEFNKLATAIADNEKTIGTLVVKLRELPYL
ncbi:MAG: hypothetical protein DRP47_08660 [Candidatus Zixiibacteriota bacterium]|nr:MAG: hypothetical protein DRP47_08660 [candidate division Zixibacteria bacterium]